MLETLAKLDAYTKLALKGRDIKGGSMMTPVFVLLIVFGLLVAYGMVSFARAGFHMRAAPKTALPFFKDPRGALAALLISGGTTFRRCLVYGAVATLPAFISLVGILIYVLMTHHS